jgi:hypothetical protein
VCLIRADQQRALNNALPIDKRPYTVPEVLAPPHIDTLNDLLRLLSPDSIDPTENCSIYLVALNDATSAPAMQLLCGHEYHFECIEFYVQTNRNPEMGASTNVKVYSCPFCRAWFKDLREVPDFEALAERIYSSGTMRAIKLVRSLWRRMRIRTTRATTTMKILILVGLLNPRTHTLERKLVRRRGVRLLVRMFILRRRRHMLLDPATLILSLGLILSRLSVQGIVLPWFLL